MNRGLYIAAVGMTTQLNRMDTVSNNIANVNTTGYKKDGVTTQSFDEQLMSRINYPHTTPIIGSGRTPIGTMNFGNTVSRVYTDFTTGSMIKTDAPLDMSISGDGFFSVQYPNSDGTTTEKYTRDGGFSLAADGSLINNDGYHVLGENGPIKVDPNSVVTVNEAGQVYSNGQNIDQLKLTAFEDNTYLKKFGQNLYDLQAGSTTKPFTGNVEQGFLEGSNVNSVSEMVNMISLSRAYEADSKVIQAVDSILQKTANEVGRKI